MWVPCLRDIDLYDVTLCYFDDEMMGHNDYDCFSTHFPWRYKLDIFSKATCLNDRYHTITNGTASPKNICLLLSLLLARNLLRRHDYLVLQDHLRCWITLFPSGTRHCEYPSWTHGEHYIGGGVSEIFSLAQLQPYVLKNHMILTPSVDVMYKFEGHHIENKQLEKDLLNTDTLLCEIPLDKIIHNLTITSLKLVAAVHGIYIKTRTPLPEVLKIIQDHNCDHCQNCITLLNLLSLW